MPVKLSINICDRARRCRTARHGVLRAVAAAVILQLILSACVKNEFTMEFRLPESVNTTCRMTYFASNSTGGLHVETAVAVAAGKAEAKGVTRFPTLVAISSGQSPLPAAIFYACRGDEIVITGDSGNPESWSIGGNKVNETLTGWRMANAKTIGEARGTTGGGSSDARRRLNSLVAGFVKEHPGDIASPLLLYSYFDAALQPEEFAALDRLVAEGKDYQDVRHLLVRQDVAGATAIPGVSGVKWEDMVVRAAVKNIDTLRFGSAARPVFLWFWRKNDPGREEIVDSLKALVKWRPDSASMTIADVALTQDSAQWSSTVRLDSLRHTVRAFSPQGFASPEIMRLGVGATPWYVVGAGKGKPAYSGQDITEALRAFRALRPKKKDKPASSAGKAAL